jgi:hypothetical protein
VSLLVEGPHRAMQSWIKLLVGLQETYTKRSMRLQALMARRQSICNPYGEGGGGGSTRREGRSLPPEVDPPQLTISSLGQEIGCEGSLDLEFYDARSEYSQEQFQLWNK